MKKLNLVSCIALVTAGLALRCSSQQGQGEEPVNGADSLDSNAIQNTSLNESTKKNAAAQGEALNNAVGGNNFAGANTPSNQAAPTNVMTNNIASNPLANPGSNPTAVPLNQTAPVNGVPLNTPVNGVPVNTAAQPTNSAAATPDPAAALPNAPATPAAPVANWDKMNASPFANPQMNWPGKGKVKYITRSTTRHASPNGPVVGDFRVGNHPLVYQNGNWVELSNGTFVKGDATTDKPVGYERGSHSYSH